MTEQEIVEIFTAYQERFPDAPSDIRELLFFLEGEDETAARVVIYAMKKGKSFEIVFPKKDALDYFEIHVAGRKVPDSLIE